MWILVLKIIAILIASFLVGAILGAFLRRSFNFEVNTIPVEKKEFSKLTSEVKSSVNLHPNSSIEPISNSLNDMNPHKNDAVEAMRLRGEQIAQDLTSQAVKIDGHVDGYKANITANTSTSELFTVYRTTQINSAKEIEGEAVKRPVGLFAPRNDISDDLKIIKGIGPTNERKLNQIGIYHFDQIAGWSAEEAEWINSFLEFPGRVAREEWVEQAKAIVNSVKI